MRETAAEAALSDGGGCSIWRRRLLYLTAEAALSDGGGCSIWRRRLLYL